LLSKGTIGPNRYVNATQANSEWQTFMSKLAASLLPCKDDVSLPTLFRECGCDRFVAVLVVTPSFVFWFKSMYSPLRAASLLVVYVSVVAGACLACHSLLMATASNIVSTQRVTADKGQAAYSRVEGWLKRQAIANVKKPTATVQVSTDIAPGSMPSVPEHDVAHALVLAAAIDNAEHTQSTPQTFLQSAQADARPLRARQAHRRVRVPTCQVLPCQTADLIPVVKPRGNSKPLMVAARTVKKVQQRPVKTALKLQKSTARNKVATQSRIKSQKRIALRRFRETPAEISYRSFVGKFVPAT
jgi:hypothetical protein